MIPVKKKENNNIPIGVFKRADYRKNKPKINNNNKKIDACTLHISMNKQKLVKKEDKHWAVNLKMPFS